MDNDQVYGKDLDKDLGKDLGKVSFAKGNILLSIMDYRHT